MRSPLTLQKCLQHGPRGSRFQSRTRAWPLALQAFATKCLATLRCVECSWSYSGRDKQEGFLDERPEEEEEKEGSLDQMPE